MNITKRNGTIVKFDRLKIVHAIENAMFETAKGINTNLSHTIAENIEKESEGFESAPTVEKIQDMVENYLMQLDPASAKSYILYRNKREKIRNSTKITNRILSDEFISKYKHMKSPMQQLGNFVYYRTYSRYLPNEGRREYWWETVRRAVEYNCSLAPINVHEAEELYDNIFNLRQFLSGRTLWTGNTDVSLKYPMSNYNCAFTVVSGITGFSDAFYLLMIGSGVGFRILKEDIEDFPKFRNNYDIIQEAYSPVNKDKRLENTSLNFISKTSVKLIIGDSKEGWVESLRLFLEIITSNTYKNIETIIINYDNVRPKGEKLKTFGGTASGHESIRTMFVKIDNVIRNRKEKGRFNIKSIDCLDIMNIIGENVVSGGVRRTSEIALIGTEDNICLNAKNNIYTQVGSNWIVNPEIQHRQMSNNSIFYTQKPTREKLHEHVKTVRFSGEPGWINAEAASKRRPNFKGVNPCVTGETVILTDQGYRRIDSLVDQQVNIWNGYEWSIVTPKVTGHNQYMTNVKLSDGTELDCTLYHKFILSNGDRVEAARLKPGDKLIKHEFPAIEGYIEEDESSMYTKGFYCGDGVTNYKRLYLYGEKANLLDKIYYENYNDEMKTNKRISVSLQEQYSKTFIPGVNYTIKSRLAYLAGIIDSDGGLLSQDGGIAINSNDRDYLMQLKYFLNTLGCTGTVSLSHPDGMKMMPDGNGGSKEYYCFESYRLIINSSNVYKLMQLGLHCHRVLLIANPNRNASRFIQVVANNIYDEPEEIVYCFTEDKNHSGIFNGLMTGQCGEVLLDSRGLCNLTTINVMAFVTVDGRLDTAKLLEAQALSARAGYRMTCPELELHSWNLIQQRDKLLGLSLTGWQDMVNATNMSRSEEESLLEALRDVARTTADSYAEKLGMRKPLLVTTVKPEGTLSLLPTVSSGVHFSHSPFYIRRVRISADDPLTKVCEELGYPVFPEVGQDIETCKTKVVEFPIKAPDGRTKKDITAIEQLEIYKMFMEHYVEHNASITVTVKNHEWDLVEDWLWENWDTVVGIALLPDEGESFYTLQPLESCTEEEYNRRVFEMKPFIPSLINKYESEDIELDIDVSDCATGACPIR